MATLWDFVHGVLPFHVFIVYLVVIDIYRAERTRIQSEKAQVQEVLGHAAEDHSKIRTSSSEINHPGSVHTKFYGRD